MLSGLSKKFGSMRHSISSEPFIRLTSDCLRGGSNLRVPRHSYSPKDTRHFPIREWLCLGADLSTRRTLSCVLQGQKAPILRGYWRIVDYYLQIQKDLRLYGGPSRVRTILHLRIPSTYPIWVQTGPISHRRFCGQNLSRSALAISHQRVNAARSPHNRAAGGT
jgi:hypothetical protein